MDTVEVSASRLDNDDDCAVLGDERIEWEVDKLRVGRFGVVEVIDALQLLEQTVPLVLVEAAVLVVTLVLFPTVSLHRQKE